MNARRCASSNKGVHRPLVFVRRAASIASPALLANWLYGVAHQTAIKARATAASRKVRERQVADMPEPAVVEQDCWTDLQPLLDQGLSRLPDIYRVVIVLCDLPHLRKLTVVSPQVTDAGLKRLGELKALEELRLNCNIVGRG